MTRDQGRAWILMFDQLIAALGHRDDFANIRGLFMKAVGGEAGLAEFGLAREYDIQRDDYVIVDAGAAAKFRDAYAALQFEEYGLVRRCTSPPGLRNACTAAHVEMMASRHPDDPPGQR